MSHAFKVKLLVKSILITCMSHIALDVCYRPCLSILLCLGFIDWTPSDVGLFEVVDKIKLGWRRIAICLGVPLADVNAFESDQDLGGLKALQQWRDGREGCRTPSTWNTLLAAVKDKLGVNVHADLEREVMTHEDWSIREETRL